MILYNADTLRCNLVIFVSIATDCNEFLIACFDFELAFLSVLRICYFMFEFAYSLAYSITKFC